MQEIKDWALNFCPQIKGNNDSVLNYTMIEKEK